MGQRKSFDEAIKNSGKNKKVESYFQSTSNIKIEEEEELKRRTYYLSPILIQALALMSARMGKEKSLIVREALEKTIPQQYLKEAEEILNRK
ncbi:hypothetical protein JJB67_15680 [Clostridium perfringens]|uniref:hypothetical protein n=1 Tax=Clostridium perfringens TaxID=1502 RepID=UPI001ABB5217|nr:hypothetical protein [Clostridium perfringens]MBO3323644.1 hypothetical protein [Clostridium perfringens]MBO3332875.1 hypothetical protein [Clostridium perfringens]